MSTDLNVEVLLKQNNSFIRTSTVEFDSPIPKRTTRCLELERKGIPFVVRGVPLDVDPETPFDDSVEWLKKLSSMSGSAHRFDGTDHTGLGGGKRAYVLPCPVDWSEWLGTSTSIPGCLRPHSFTDEFPESINTASCVVGASDCEDLFEEGAQGTTNHSLLCTCDPETSVVWFMTSSHEAQNVYDYLSPSAGHQTPCTLTLEALAEAPFKVYVYTQKRGDLVVLPPRSYCQRRFQGTGANMSWSRMTLRGLEFAVFYDFYQRQRLCIPMKFPVKSLAFQAMASRFEGLRNAGEDVTRSSIVEIRTLLGMVDEILGVESYPERDQLPSLNVESSDDLICASCGGEIFLTVFRCESSCLRDGETEFSAKSQVIICPLCFVDGRTCSCQDMRPARFREIGPFTEVRNTVHELVYDIGEDILLFEDEDQADHTNVHSVLTAALLLSQKRSQKSDSTEACTFRRRQKGIPPSHPTPQYSLLRCSGCHSAKCFHHILDSTKVHSSTAILIHAVDGADTRSWHRHHIDNRNDYADNYSDLVSSMENWRPYNLSYRLVYFAVNFKPHQFVNQNITAGFYDTKVSDVVEQPLPAKPQSKRGTKPSTSSIASVQDIAGQSSSMGRGKAVLSRTSSVSSLNVPRPSNKKRARAASPDLSAGDSSVQEEVRASKRLRTRGRKAVMVSEDSEPLPVLDENTYLVSESDVGPTTHAAKSTQKYSPAKPLKSFDPEVDMEDVVGLQSEEPRQYQSTWKSLISSPKSSALNQESRAGPASAGDIRDIVKENLRELIPQYLGNTYSAPRDLTIINQHDAPERLSRGPSPFPGRDDGIPLQKGIVSRPTFSSDFTFKFPNPQIQSGDKRKNEGTGGHLLPQSLMTPPVESSGVGHRMAFQLQTPAQKRPHGTNLFMDLGGTAHTPHRSTSSQQSDVHHAFSEHPHPRGNWNSTTARASSMVFEGSSPTLRVTTSRSLNRSVSRSLGQLPTKPRGAFNNHLPQPSTSSAADHRVSGTDPFALEEAGPPPEPSRRVRRTDSMKSLPDDRRKRDAPPSSESAISPENLLYYLGVMEKTIRDVEGWHNIHSWQDPRV